MENNSSYKNILPLSNQQWSGDEPIMVSVVVATYNHEKYIAQTIDGILMQETNFRVEILVNDDASTDSTAQVVKEYNREYPQLFRNFYQPENQYSKGVKPWIDILFPIAKGKYIAICEGDDYWTDPFKLQKQVDFLEENSDFSFSFHDALVIDENTGKQHLRIGNRAIDTVVDLKSVIIQNNFPTASLVYRTNVYNSVSEKILKTSKGDYALVIRLAEKGLGKYISEVMSAYRLHEGGVWSSMSMDYKLTESVKFYDLLYDYFEDPAIRKVIVQKRNSTIHSLSLAALRRGEFRKGLAGLIRHWNFTSDKRLKTPIRKILSAIKEGIKHHLKTKNNK